MSIADLAEVVRKLYYLSFRTRVMWILLQLAVMTYALIT